MQLQQPLAFLHIALAPWQILGVTYAPTTPAAPTPSSAFDSSCRTPSPFSSLWKMDGARPGCDRFKSLSNGVKTDVVPTPVATMPVIANTGATLLIGHEAPGNV